MDGELARAEELLANGDASEALEIFVDAHVAAIAGGDESVAARAMLGRAQAEFAMRRLSLAAEHAADAQERLAALAMPQAKHAADLLVQIDHNRYLA